IQLYELNINEKHKWNKKQIQNLSLTKNTSIIMIRRNSETIIPQGNTIILDGDTLVMCGK
ncbi:MAG: K+/H+ antiporter, partial [Ruminococcus sp.]|nr:K+/H+ antiporter [Ruminococcus sp.]